MIRFLYVQTTPLHLASSRGHVQVVTLLLQWHANVSLRDSDGNNCLFEVLRSAPIT